VAVDMFLELAGVKGETADKVYRTKNAIDILAWSWGCQNSATFHDGSGGGLGKANFQDLSISKYVDSATPGLMSSCASGKHLDKATITMRKSGGAKPHEYLKIHLEKILVSGYGTGGTLSDASQTENLILNFAKVKVEYLPQSPDGGKVGSIDFSWDIAGNAKE